MKEPTEQQFRECIQACYSLVDDIDGLWTGCVAHSSKIMGLADDVRQCIRDLNATVHPLLYQITEWRKEENK